MMSKMKHRTITIEKDVSLLVDSIVNIISETIKIGVPQLNLHHVDVRHHSSKSIHCFEFWSTDEQVHKIKKIIYGLYDLKEEES